jgi:hypothetical protein
MADERKNPDPDPELPPYLEDIRGRKLPTLSKTPKNWGDNPNHIITVDETIQVVTEIAKKVNKEFLVLELSITLPLQLDFTKIQTEIGKELDCGKTRIYICVNSNSVSSSVSHQNWICVMKNPKQIIRFEPSQDYEEFGFKEFCKKFNGFAYVIDENAYGLNKISGCRLYSTILALNHILDIDIKTLLECFGYETFENCPIEELRKFDYTVQLQLRKFLENYPARFEGVRTRHNKFSFRNKKSKKSVRKSKKTVRKSKKSVRNSKKSVRKSKKSVKKSKKSVKKSKKSVRKSKKSVKKSKKN